MVKIPADVHTPRPTVTSFSSRFASDSRWTVYRHCTFVLGIACVFLGGCNPLRPRPIEYTTYNIAPELLEANTLPIERGNVRPWIDSIGWITGVPSRILLWDPRIDNHHISQETEGAIAQYLAENDLHHVKVRLNQYAPLDDWRRLKSNRSMAWGYRYTLGSLSVLGETIFAGRLLGGDHYNPFTATVHLYSDVPSIALHEAAHAKDFARRRHPGNYALYYLIPIVPLWHEKIATSDVMSYVIARGDIERLREAYRILYPAYGTYAGGALGYAAPKYADPIFYASVLCGHAAAHHQVISIPESEPFAGSPPLDFEDIQTSDIADPNSIFDLTEEDLGESTRSRSTSTAR